MPINTSYKNARCILHFRPRALLTVLRAALVVLCAGSAFAQPAAWVNTDQPDYPPGSTVNITGGGFTPGETVTCQVLHNPTGGDDATSPAHQPWTTTADDAGNISTTWDVPSAEDELGATLQLTTTGQTSGLTAQVTFTDGQPPTVDSISPTSKCAGDASFTLTVNGQNYDNTCIVRVNGANRTTTFVSSSKLTATILSSDVASAGNLTIDVFRVSDSKPSSTSQTLTVGAVPSISGQPTSQTACAGQTATFTVTTPSGVSYQWQVSTDGGLNFANVTTGTGGNMASYTTPATAIADSGNKYRVQVSGSCGPTVTSSSATLTVNPLPACSISGATAVCASSTANSYSGPASMAGYNWSIAGGTIVGSTTSQSVSVTAGTGASFTLTLTVTDGNGCQSTCTDTVTINPLPSATITSASSVCAGSTGNAASVPTSTGGAYAWTISGGIITSAANTASITFTAGSVSPVTLNVTVTSSAGCSSSNSKNITINPLPNSTITAPSAVCASSTGNTASVPTTSGATYQWTISGGTITAGSTTATATFTAGTGSSVTLSATVTSAGCSSTSSQSVTVNPLPACSISGSSSVCASSTGNSYSGPAGMNAYSWSVNSGGTIVGSATSQSVSVTAGTGASYILTLTVTDANGCKSTCTDTVTINALPSSTITSASSVCAGSTGNAASVPTSTGGTYAWTISGGTITSAANTASITFTAGSVSPVTLNVTVTSSAGCSSSSSKNVTINQIPSSTITAASAVCASSTGNTASVPATSGATYQWTISGGTITAGSTTTAVTFTAGTGSSLTLNATVTSAGCSSTSSQSVTVNPGVAISAQPTSATKCVGDTVSFSVSANNATAYQWRKGGTPISGATDSSYTINSVQTTDAASYTCIVSGIAPCASVTSSAATLTVNSPPSITSNPGDKTGCSGATATFTVTASGTGLTYQWRTNGVPIANGASGNGSTYGGATSATLGITNVTAADAGSYDVVVNGTCTPSATSSAATLTVNAQPTCAIVGADGVAVSTTGNIYSAPAGMTTYAWTVSGGTITAGAATQNATITAGTGASMTVNLTMTANGCSSTCSKVVTLLAPYAPTLLGTDSDTSSSTTALSISANVLAGNTIFVTVAADPGTYNVGVTDVVGNTYTMDATVNNASGVRTLVFSAPVTTTLSSSAIGVTFSGTGTPFNKAATFFSINDMVAPPKDVSTTATGNGFTASAGPVSTSRSDEWLIGVVGHADRTASFTADTGYTSVTPTSGNPPAGGVGTSGQSQGNGVVLFTEFEMVSATGSYSADASTSQNKSAQWAAAIVTYKKKVPTVALVNAITLADPTPSGANTVHFTVTFTEAVFGVDTSDFTVVQGTGLSGASVSSVTGSGTTYTVTVNTGTGNGSLGLNLIDNDTILDIDDTPLAGTGTHANHDGVPPDGSYAGPAYTINKDTTTVASSATATYGDTSVTLNATVTASAGANPSSGTVNFSVDGSSVGSATPSSGAASFNYNPSSLSAGSHTLSASFSGGGYNSSTSADTTLAIAQKTVTPSITAASKVYDGTTGAGFSPSLIGVLPGDIGNVGLFVNGANFANKNVGNGKTVTFTGLSLTGSKAANYVLSSTTTTATANITQRSITVAATGVNKTYDGNSTATVSLSDNKLSGDAVTDAYASASFANKNVGTGKTVSVSGISISGGDSGNYSLASTTASTTANIAARALTISATGSNKVYDGTTAATVTLSDNRVSGDVFTDAYTSATFSDKNFGTAKAISVSGISTSGTDAGNYTFNSTASATADITARALTVSATGVNKVYDGTTTATVTLSDNKVSGDSVSDAYSSASFASKTVGTAKPVSVSGISISGTDAGNYTFNSTASTAADITARTLLITAHGVNKTYDGATTATVTLSDDRVSGDVFTDSYASASFADKNSSTGKAVSVSGISISGSDAGNYTFNSTAATTADITGRTLTVTATGVSKVYDGGTSATVTLSDDRVAGDSVTDSYTSASFADKSVGTGKNVSVSGISISGTDAGNYSLASTTASTTADITQRDLTVTATGVNKVYDGGTSATVALSDNKVSGDSVSDSYASASYGDKNVGTTKPVSVSGITIGGADAGNYHLLNNTSSTTADITARDLTVTATGANKVYDGTTAATVTLSDDRVSGDDVTDSYTSAAFADKNVGTGKSVSVSGIAIGGGDAGNYNLVNIAASTAADITARGLTISASGINKVYDGTAAATVNLSDDRVSGDVFTDAYTSASFNNKSVATGKPVSVSGISISGTDAGNYTFNSTASTAADITARPLLISAHGVNKTYDGNATATVTLSDDRVSGDLFTDSYTSASFADKNSGTGKAVSVSGISISGADAGNYTFNTTAGTTADITGRTLTVAATGVNKVYDATTTATVTLSDDRVAGDTVTDSYTSASFADKNVGTGKSVSVSGISISGTDAGNYTLASTAASATADIAKRDLTVTATGVNKVYDGGTSATVALSDNKVSGDSVSDSYTSASFADRNVGSGKTVSVSGITIGGGDAGNYNLLNTTASTTADITTRDLTVAAAGVNKVYDGNTTATVTLSDNKVSGDDVTDSFSSAAFADKTAASGKSVSVSGISIGGADASNYNLVNTTASATADITARALTISASGINKVYDGTAVATVALSDDKVAGDAVSDSYTSASFSDKNVGTAKPVSVSGLSISGADAGNYTFNTSASAAADITARALLVAAHSVNKTYDGSTTATVTLSDNRVSGDVFGDSYSSASFADKNTGNGKAVSVSGISISGTDAGNYTFNTTAGTTADITGRTLTVTATGVNRVYDGGTSATVTLSDDRVAGDVFTDSYSSAAFADKNVGTDKSVSVSGISISGSDAGNYTLASTAASATADITKRDLAVSAAGVNKIYDSTTSATVTLSDNKVSGDTVTDSYTSASFADKNVGSGKTVSVSGVSISGADSGNYHLLNTTASTTADITARDLTVAAAGVNKVYDGNTTATVTLSDDKFSGDVVSDSYTSASFADKSAGSGKSVSVSGIAIGGADAGNYNLVNTIASTSADITARALTISASGVNKVYDGTTGATVTLSDDRVSGDVFADGYASASFADKNVATAKPVSVSGLSISGADAGNYSFNTTAGTTADITARALQISAHGVNKTYDGTTAATVTLSDDRVSGDVFGDSYSSASFADKNTGNGKAVSVSGISTSGADAGNYTFNTTAGTTADITGRTLTVAATGANKVYDATTTATVTLSDDRVAGDVVTDSYSSAAFADRNVGTSKSVSVSGISISGADAVNYTLASTAASATADITKRNLTVTATGMDKVYDGTTSATVTFSTDKVSGDDVTASDSANFSDKSVGNAKTISVTGISISGADAGNYNLLSATASASANITVRALTVAAAGINKGYDGTADATVTLSDNKVSGDDVSDSYTSASFADRNVGTGKSVSVSGITISGGDSGNYSFNTAASTTADITARTLTVSAAGVNKVYDGTGAATVTLSDDRVSGDVFTDSYTSATFGDKNVGTGKAVTVSGISISGTDAGNYTFNTTATTTANITARSLTVAATGVDKVYDGTTAATVTLSDNRVSGDVFTDSYTSASFATRTVGTAKPVSVSGISISGTDAGNYTANTAASTAADITQRGLTVTATGHDKVYDGTTSATVTLSDNRVAGDAITDSFASANFSDKQVGNNKTVTVTGITISGADAPNYNLLNTTATTTANITKKQLNVTATGVNKTYDSSSAATVTLSDDRVSGDSFTDTCSASFADKNVGTGKTISVSGITITGADAGNYTCNTSTACTADITQRDLHVTATGVNKVYDGTTAASVTLLGDQISGDAVTASDSASFASKNVGTGKTVSVTGISISGGDAGNYNLVNSTASTTANITSRSLTVTATGVNKVYDGTSAATVTLSDDRVSGDVITDGYSSASFADANVGSGKTVGVSGISITGTDSGNYSLANTSATTTANITAAGTSTSVASSLNPSASGQNVTFTATVSSTAGTPGGAVTFKDGVLTLGSGTLNGSGQATFSTTTLAVGGHSITAVYAAQGNYSGSSSPVLTQTVSTAGDTEPPQIHVTCPTGPLTLGAVVNTGVTATDNVAVDYAHSTLPATFDTSAVGTRTTTFIAVDTSGNSVTMTCSYQVIYVPSGTCGGVATHQILQPINADGTSVFKQGSTVPAKFIVSDASCNSVGTSGVVTNFVLYQTSSGQVSGVNEIVDSTTPDNAFRWDPTGKQWIFNISTKSLKANVHYYYEIDLNDESKILFSFGLR